MNEPRQPIMAVFYEVWGDEPMGSTFTPPQRFCVHVREEDALSCVERLKRNGVTGVSISRVPASLGPCDEC